MPPPGGGTKEGKEEPDDEVAWRPQGTPPQLLVDARVVLLADHATGDAFEAVHQCRDRHLRWVVHQQVNMVILAVELHQFRLEVQTLARCRTDRQGFPW